MAADQDTQLDELEADPPDAKAKNTPKPGQPPLLLRIILGLAGLLLLVGFFLPWLKIEVDDISNANGLSLAMRPHDSQSWVLFFVPGFGVALTAVGFLGLRYSGQIAAAIGALLVGYGLVTVIMFFFHTTDYGLWMVLGGAFVAILAGVITFVRSRVDAKEAARQPSASDDTGE